VSLVDPRGRQDEDLLRTLLADAHGSASSVEGAVECYRTREWSLVGSQEDGRVIAFASTLAPEGLER